MTDNSSAFIDALAAPGPAAERGTNMELYAWLIGSWDLDVTRYLSDGTTRRRPGEWHFGWVLEGRAIQDVWIVPPRGAARAGDAVQNVNAYGTTLRIYDPAIDAWHIQWCEPVTQTYLSMIGRKAGDAIEQLGDGPGGSKIRWRFSEIAARSFFWRGEVSLDDGRSWRPQIDFRARRTAA